MVYPLVKNSFANDLTQFTFAVNIQDMAEEFILGSQSDKQKEVLAKYDTKKPLYVEGPFFMWLRRLKRHYYILRADVAHQEEDNEGI